MSVKYAQFVKRLNNSGVVLGASRESWEAANASAAAVEIARPDRSPKRSEGATPGGAIERAAG